MEDGTPQVEDIGSFITFRVHIANVTGCLDNSYDVGG